MEDVKRLHSDHVPILKRVWIHHNDVMGINSEGEPVILAHLEGNEGARGDTRVRRTRGPRKKKEDEVKLPPEE